MKKLGYLFFFIVIAGVILGMTGFLSLLPIKIFPDTKEITAGTGFTILNQSDPFMRISFLTAASRIPLSLSEREENTTAAGSIRMIQGKDLDSAGNASSWDIIVCQQERAYLITYSHYGDRIYNWSGRCPEQEIVLSQVVVPREIFIKNRDRIFRQPEQGANESRDLTLAGNTYYLTITGPGIQRELRFDARTGAMISTNE